MPFRACRSALILAAAAAGNMSASFKGTSIGETYQQRQRDLSTRSWCHAKEETWAESGFDFFELRTVDLQESVIAGRSATAFEDLALSGRIVTAF
jgi:hypothetical protein